MLKPAWIPFYSLIYVIVTHSICLGACSPWLTNIIFCKKQTNMGNTKPLFWI